MTDLNNKFKKLSLAIAVGSVISSSAFAQNSRNDTLEEVISIGSATGGETRLESSISVSSLSAEEMTNFSPTSTADIFRNLPGYRIEASGGEGNANISVRGLPVPDGGARYVQLQEDGLPVVMFGDIAFGNADFLLRADATVERVETVRGGSSMVLYSGAPGGAINLVSKTGLEEGGSATIKVGLDHDLNRTDFEYGSYISDDLRFHVGGFYRQGEGVRDTGYDAYEGGQIKANLTKEFDNGYVRLYFKSMDDIVPGYLPMATRKDGSSLPGFDSTEDAPQSAYLLSGYRVNQNNGSELRDYSQGVHAQSDAFGLELSFDLGSNVQLENRFRKSDNSLDFALPFISSVDTLEKQAIAIGGAGATLEYANGPNQGNAVAFSSSSSNGLNGNGLAQQIAVFDTDANDLSSYANDLQLIAGFGEAITVTFGYYKSAQNIDQSWSWNSLLQEVKGENAALLNVRNASDELVTDRGVISYGGVKDFGGFGRRIYNVDYDIDAPYLDFQWDIGPFTIDLGGRYDTGEVTGGLYTSTAKVPLDVNGDGNISVPEQTVQTIDATKYSSVNYDYDYFSYTAGLNWMIFDNLSTFIRWSDGGRANGERILGGAGFVPGDSGDLRDNDFAYDEVSMLDIGLKFIGDNFSLLPTIFYAESAISNSFEATTQSVIDQEYQALGLELEGAFYLGLFSLTGSATYTDAEITTGAFDGNTPRRQADFIYTLTPQLNFNMLDVGLNFIGTTDSYINDANTDKMDAYIQTNFFFNYFINEALTVSLTVNNAFDEEGVTEVEGLNDIVYADGSTVEAARLRTIMGRNTSLGLTYRF